MATIYPEFNVNTLKVKEYRFIQAFVLGQFHHAKIKNKIQIQASNPHPFRLYACILVFLLFQ